MKKKLAQLAVIIVVGAMIPLIAFGAAAEFYCTSLYNDANYLYYYRLEGLTEAKGGTSLTNVGSMSFNPAMFNNGADSGTSNGTKLLYNANNYAGQITISAWVKPYAIPAGTGNASGWMIGAVGSSTNHVTNGIIYVGNGGAPFVLFARQKQGVAEDDASYSTTLSTTTFTMLTATWDGASMYLYVNGTQQSSASSSNANGSGSPDATLSMYCADPGGYFTGYADNRTSNTCGGHPFSGLIDDFVVMSRALTSAEVSGLYNGTLSASGNCSAGTPARRKIIDVTMDRPKQLQIKTA